MTAVRRLSAAFDVIGIGIGHRLETRLSREILLPSTTANFLKRKIRCSPSLLEFISMKNCSRENTHSSVRDRERERERERENRRARYSLHTEGVVASTRTSTGLANRVAYTRSAVGQREQRRVQRPAAEISPRGCNLQNCHWPRRACELPLHPSFGSFGSFQREKREREGEREREREGGREGGRLSSNSQWGGSGEKGKRKRNGRKERKERFNEIDASQRSPRTLRDRRRPGEIHVRVVPIVCLGAAKISPAWRRRASTRATLTSV